jgi:hypothetical protein
VHHLLEDANPSSRFLCSSTTNKRSFLPAFFPCPPFPSLTSPSSASLPPVPPLPFFSSTANGQTHLGRTQEARGALLRLPLPLFPTSFLLFSSSKMTSLMHRCSPSSRRNIQRWTSRRRTYLLSLSTTTKLTFPSRSLFSILHPPSFHLLSLSLRHHSTLCFFLFDGTAKLVEAEKEHSRTGCNELIPHQAHLECRCSARESTLFLLVELFREKKRLCLPFRRPSRRRPLPIPSFPSVPPIQHEAPLSITLPPSRSLSYRSSSKEEREKKR